jgi:regulator of protease activity HflC (stomatin/prohibitin superfamily)
MSDSMLGELEARLDELELALAEARPMPLSASVLVSRDELTQLVAEIRELLPNELRQARWVLRERENVLNEAEQTAQRVIADAEQERLRLTGETEVLRAAEREAKRVTREAQEQARAMRLEAEDYIDARLARFELVLQKTLKTVAAGRERLRSDAEAMTANGSTALFDHEQG